MTADFSDPKNQRQGDLEDLRLEIDQKAKALQKVENELKENERQKELFEADLDDLKKQEVEIEKEINRMDDTDPEEDDEI